MKMKLIFVLISAFFMIPHVTYCAIWEKTFNEYDGSVNFVCQLKESKVGLLDVFSRQQISDACFIKKIKPDNQATYIYTIFAYDKEAYYENKMFVEVDGIKYEMNKDIFPDNILAHYILNDEIAKKIACYKKSLVFITPIWGKKEPTILKINNEKGKRIKTTIGLMFADEIKK